ncbi:MAG: hypothetical protein WB676_06965 [Bryobacteraceae bacterium]
MTCREAHFTLAAKRPVFGDERCIQARDVLVLAAEMRSARYSWESPDGLSELPAEYYLPVSDMDEQQLREELARWHALGNGEDWP